MNDFLFHYGIKGQKWGVRRFQNEDGSFTDEGRQHYGLDQGGNKKFDRLYKRQFNKLSELRNKSDVFMQQRKARFYEKHSAQPKSGFDYHKRLNSDRATLARYRSSRSGHAKQLKKYQEQVSKMEKMFANTKYSDFERKLSEHNIKRSILESLYSINVDIRD